MGFKTILGLEGISFLTGSHYLGFTMHSSPKMHEARFYRKLNGNRVQCLLCFHKCVVSNGKRGFCRNRENRDGIYYSIVYGKPSALQVDPIEKEPCYHMWPGSKIFCTGTASCNNRCQFCHNWHLSQKSLEDIYHYEAQPEDIVKSAIKYDCKSVSFTYNEPTVFFECMYDISQIAKKVVWLFYTTLMD
jgi:pyruvate formate lyase activating enzyme